MGATQDFNYKVALASGLRSLQAGRLRQAEEQFRYLVEKFPGSPGGYRGLAKVLVELEDRAAAFAILRDGGSALAKAGDREGGSGLFRDAVGMEPRDTTTHRRFAATLSLAGDLDGAAAEVERYVEAQSGPAGDPARARLEVAYAVESLGEHPRLAALAARFGIGERTAPVDDLVEPAVELAPATSVPAELAPVRPAPAIPAPAAPAAPAASGDAAPDTGALEQRAAELIARRDPGALKVALEVARLHFAQGHTDAASDLLLQLISSGIGGHEAQRVLVDVVRAGRPDLAREKSVLLAEVERLAGPV